MTECSEAYVPRATAVAVGTVARFRFPDFDAGVTTAPNVIDALLVQRRPADAERLRLRLERAGVRVEVVATPADAMRRLRQERISMLVLDGDWPGLDTSALARLLVRALGRGAPTVVITRDPREAPSTHDAAAGSRPGDADGCAVETVLSALATGPARDGHDVVRPTQPVTPTVFPTLRRPTPPLAGPAREVIRILQARATAAMPDGPRPDSFIAGKPPLAALPDPARSPAAPGRLPGRT